MMKNKVTHRGLCLGMALAGMLAIGQTQVARAGTSTPSPANSAESGVTAEVESIWNWIVSQVESLTETVYNRDPPCPSRLCGGGGGGGNDDR